MNWKRDLKPPFLVVLCLCLTFSKMHAQNTAGSVVGHITDSTSSAIAGATVTISNVDTHESRAGVSSGAGDYTFSLLKPGTYSLVVIATGFKTANLTRIALDVDQTVRGDVSLSVGSKEETVNVSSSAAVLDTDSSSVGQVIDSKQIQDLPLNGRNFQDLLFLAPGAVNNPSGEQSTYRIVISGGGDSSISLGGSRGSSNGYTVDGTTILDMGYDTPAFAPSLDRSTNSRSRPRDIRLRMDIVPARSMSAQRPEPIPTMALSSSFYVTLRRTLLRTVPPQV